MILNFHQRSLSGEIKSMQIHLRWTILALCMFARSILANPVSNLPMSIWGERETGILTAGWTALELPDGRIAIGGHTLLIFDGDRWQSFQMGNSYALRGMDLGSDGRIWAGATNELGYFDPTPEGKFTYHSLKELVPEEIRAGFFTWSTFSTNNGAIYITDKGVLEWDQKDFNFTPLTAATSSVAFKIKEGVVVYSPSVGAIIFSNGTQRQIIPQETIAPARIAWGYGSLDELTLVTTHGIKKGSTVGGDNNFSATNNPNPILSKVTSGARLPNGRVLITARQNGLFEIKDDGNLIPIEVTNDSSPKFINGILASSDGSAWILMRESIARISFDAEIYELGSSAKGLPITAVTKFKGQIHASTDHGTYRLEGRQFEKILAIPESRAWALRNLDDEILAIGSELGVGIYDGVTYQQIPGPYEVFQLGYASKDALIATTALGISNVNIQFGKSVRILRDLPDIPNFITNSSPSRFWFSAHSKGVFFASSAGDRFTYKAAITIPSGQPFKPPAAVGVASGRTVVMNDEGIYLNTDQGTSFKRARSAIGYVHEYSNPDSTGRIWISLGADPKNGLTNRVGRLSVQRDEVIWEPLDLKLPHRNGSPYSIFCDQDFLWIGTEFGVVKYPLAKAGSPRVPKVPLLFISGDRLIDPKSSTPAFPYGSLIRLEYSSVEYASREALRFQTLVSGITPNWSSPTNEAATQLVGLREGIYEFSVRSSIDGVISEPARIRFEVLPPWWRTTVAYATYGLLFLGVTMVGIRLRERRQRRHTSTLEGLVSKRTEQLQRANEAKTEFFTAMSHDVRTPINGIMGSAMELSKSALSHDQRVLVQRIQGCSSMLCTLVEDVLDFSAIESGHAPVADLPFSLEEFARSVSTVLQAGHHGSLARVKIAIGAEVPAWVRGDEGRIRQILVNYGSNALKYSRDGSFTLRIEQDGDNLVFSVIDQGPGISEQNQKKLFNRFSRLEGGSDKMGRGLGLAGCRVIARFLSGTVGVNSEEGKGSEFWLRVPLRSATPNMTALSINSSGRFDLSALLVEDVHYSAEASRSVLESLGFKVEIADSGLSAIDRLKVDSFDVVFLDINLPDISGTEVAAAIRALDGPASRVCILATTAHSTTDQKTECIQSGMNGFVSKPLTPEKVSKALFRAHVTARAIDADDTSQVFAMLDLISKGSPHELRRNANVFIAEVTREMDRLVEACAQEDWGQMRRTAHRMITHARLAGDKDFMDAADELESTLCPESFDRVKAQVRRLQMILAAVRDRLEDHVRQAECG